MSFLSFLNFRITYCVLLKYSSENILVMNIQPKHTKYYKLFFWNFDEDEESIHHQVRSLREP